MSKYFSRLGRMDKKIYWLFIFSFAALLSFITIVYQQNKIQDKSRQDIYHTYSAIHAFERFNTAIVETESALRSYLITKNPLWKEQLYLLHKQLRDSLDAIQALINNRPGMQLQLDTLGQLLNQKIASQDSIARAEILSDAMFAKIGSMGSGRTIKYAIRPSFDGVFSNETIA